MIQHHKARLVALLGSPAPAPPRAGRPRHRAARPPAPPRVQKLSLDLDRLIPEDLQPGEPVAASSAFNWKAKRGNVKSRVQPLRSSGE